MYKRKVLNNYGGEYMKKLIAEEYNRFEDIKQIREDGSEFWSARDLASALDYNSTFPADISKQSLYKCRLRAYPIGHFTFYAGCDIC